MAEPGRNALGADRVLEVFGETVIIRRDPAGALVDAAVIEEIVPPGVAAPLHRHGMEDEISYVIEGTFRIWRGDEVLDVGPGGIALLPRHQAHTFKNIGTGPGRLLTVIQPAGFERFFEVVAERHLGDEDMDEITTVAAEFGLEILVRRRPELGVFARLMVAPSNAASIARARFRSCGSQGLYHGRAPKPLLVVHVAGKMRVHTGVPQGNK